MTPAEKMAKTLDCVSCNLDGEYRDDIPEDAAAMLRRLAAALSEAEAAMPHNEFFFWRKRHAEALRDIKGDA